MKRAGVHQKGTFSMFDMITDLKNRKNFDKAGAFTMFVGVVRGRNEKNENVQELEIQAYEEKADGVLAEICNDLKKKPGIVDVQIHHMLGKFNVGEDLVYVLVAGSHRQDIYPVLQEAVERYKHQAPIFKKEHSVSERGEKKARWIEENNQPPGRSKTPSSKAFQRKHQESMNSRVSNK